MSETPKWIIDLVADLIQMSKPENPNRAALAHLRRGLGDDPTYTLMRVGWLFRAAPDFALNAAVLAAGLYALAKGDCPQSNDVTFGKAFGSLQGRSENASVEKRFVDLLDTDQNDLPYKLRQALTLISREGIAFDWKRLIRDLLNWDRPERFVQRRWARDFWAGSVRSDEAVTATAIIEPS